MNRLSAFLFLPLLLGFQGARVSHPAVAGEFSPAASRESRVEPPPVSRSAPPEPAVSPVAADLASALSGELQRTEWGQREEEWLALHPQAECEVYRSGRREVGQPVEPGSSYCSRCTWTEGAVTTVVTFYPVAGDGEPACRLLEFFARSEAPGEVAGARRELVRLLTSRFGEGERTRPSTYGRLGERLWSSQHLKVEAFAWSRCPWRTVLENELRCDPPDAHDEARRRILASGLLTEQDEEEAFTLLGKNMDTLVVTASRLESGKRLSDGSWSMPGPSWIEKKKTRDARLQEHLRGLDPEAADLLQKGSQIEKAELRAVLERLLGAARNAEANDKAALLLAADQLAGPLHVWPESVEEITRESLPLVDTVAGYRLTFKPDLLGDVNWEYSHDLVWDAWRTGSGEWAEEAFLELQDMGWSGEEDCFREVIEQGERFLAEAPDSPRTVQVLFAVAQAYETWWSLSRDAGEDGMVDDPARFEPGAGAALSAAIAAYERLLEIAPESAEAQASRRALLYLHLGVDTRQRRFHCVSVGC